MKKKNKENIKVNYDIVNDLIFIICQDSSIVQQPISIEEEIQDFRLYPEGDDAFKKFTPGKFSLKIPVFSFDKKEQQELETAREIQSDQLSFNTMHEK